MKKRNTNSVFHSKDENIRAARRTIMYFCTVLTTIKNYLKKFFCVGILMFKIRLINAFLATFFIEK